MGYHGDKLAPLFDDEPVHVVMRKMAERGGDRLHTRVVENTPIGGREGEGHMGGNLRSSWYIEPVRHRRRGGYTVYEVKVATNVDYAPDVEHGTGLYGPKHAKYLIEPKTPGGVLHWRDPKTGQEVFARHVWHPGSPGQHMMASAIAIVEREIEGGLFDDLLEEWKRAQEAHAD